MPEIIGDGTGHALPKMSDAAFREMAAQEDCCEIAAGIRCNCCTADADAALRSLLAEKTKSAALVAALKEQRQYLLKALDVGATMTGLRASLDRLDLALEHTNKGTESKVENMFWGVGKGGAWTFTGTLRQCNEWLDYMRKWHPCYVEGMLVEKVDNAAAGEDKGRCEVCGWPLAASVKEGCVPGNCSMRSRSGSRA